MVGTVTAGGQVMAGGSESRIVMPTQMVTLLEQRSVAVQQMLMRVGQVPAMPEMAVRVGLVSQLSVAVATIGGAA